MAAPVSHVPPAVSSDARATAIFACRQMLKAIMKELNIDLFKKTDAVPLCDIFYLLEGDNLNFSRNGQLFYSHSIYKTSPSERKMLIAKINEALVMQKLDTKVATLRKLMSGNLKYPIICIRSEDDAQAFFTRNKTVQILFQGGADASVKPGDLFRVINRVGTLFDSKVGQFNLDGLTTRLCEKHLKPEADDRKKAEPRIPVGPVVVEQNGAGAGAGAGAGVNPGPAHHRGPIPNFLEGGFDESALNALAFQAAFDPHLQAALMAQAAEIESAEREADEARRVIAVARDAADRERHEVLEALSAASAAERAETQQMLQLMALLTGGAGAGAGAGIGAPNRSEPLSKFPKFIRDKAGKLKVEIERLGFKLFLEESERDASRTIQLQNSQNIVLIWPIAHEGQVAVCIKKNSELAKEVFYNGTSVEDIISSIQKQLAS